MIINGTLVNYFFHCKRQCWLHGNRINLEDNSEDVKIGKSIHSINQEKGKNTEISIDNIKVDKITNDYLVEVKKSDSDIDAVKWQTLFYLKKLKEKGVIKKGKIEFIESRKNKKILIIELDEMKEKKLNDIEKEIKNLLFNDEIPNVLNEKKCEKCAYFYYCYI